jgi:hypothetical protein
MKRIRAVAAALALSATLFTPRAEAQTFANLGWNSSMTMTCLNVGCSSIQFVLSLSGLQAFENSSNIAVPPAVLALGSPGYPDVFTIQLGTGPGTFLTAFVTSPGVWIPITSSGTTTQFQATSPLIGAPVTVIATMSAPGAYSFSYTGNAYISSTRACFDANGVQVANCNVTTAGKLYQGGDYRGAVTTPTNVVPEPMSMTLLGTGLLGLGLVGLKRRKQNAAK